MDDEARSSFAAEASRRDDVILLSAVTGEGCDELLPYLSKLLTKSQGVHIFNLDAHAGAALAWLHAHGAIIDETFDEETVSVTVRMSDIDVGRFQSRVFA